MRFETHSQHFHFREMCIRILIHHIIYWQTINERCTESSAFSAARAMASWFDDSRYGVVARKGSATFNKTWQ